MAIRLICDQCGNSTSQLKIHSFCAGQDVTASVIQLNLGGPVNNGLYQGAQNGFVTLLMPELVTLCSVCGPIWMNRVRALCNVSNP